MTDKLRECPFCGVQLENYPPSEIWVHPDNGCLLSLRGITKEQFSAWNTRKPMDRIVEQLERLPNVNSDYWNFADLIDREDAIDIVKGVQNE